MDKQIIQTKDAPSAIGAYSQAVKVSSTFYISGQIGLDPQTMQMQLGIEAQIHQVFKNLQAILNASGGDFSNVVRLSVYLTDLSNLVLLNQIMQTYMKAPYPARSAIGVKELPKAALIEIDAIAAIE